MPAATSEVVGLHTQLAVSAFRTLFDSLDMVETVRNQQANVAIDFESRTYSVTFPDLYVIAVIGFLSADI